jgi:Uma2 family endonuclease
MAEVAEKLLTWDEFASMHLDGPYELVDGRLEKLVPSSPFHSWTGGRIFSLLDPYLEAYDPEGWWGVELDIPTLPYSYGRRPDFFYYSAEAAARSLDLAAKRARGAPTLVVEVVSEDDEERDTVTKRLEYAEAGIPHYWILDPNRKTALTLVLQEGRYEVAGEFSGDAALTSDLFPGLEVPLSRLFR